MDNKAFDGCSNFTGATQLLHLLSSTCFLLTPFSSSYVVTHEQTHFICLKCCSFFTFVKIWQGTKQPANSSLLSAISFLRDLPLRYTISVRYVRYRGFFIGFSDNKCPLLPLKMQPKEIKNQYNQGEPQTKQHGHSQAVKKRVKSGLKCQTNNTSNFVCIMDVWF